MPPRKVRRVRRTSAGLTAPTGAGRVGDVHPAAMAAALAFAAGAPTHAPRPFVPQARIVNFAQGAPPGDGPETQVGNQAAYVWDTNTIYHQGQISRFERGHEMGHAFDGQVLSDGDRNKFTRLMGLSGPWSKGTGTARAGLRSPDEIFADWYANAAIGNDPARKWDSAYSTPPSLKQFRAFQMALARLGRRQQLPIYRSH